MQIFSNYVQPLTEWIYHHPNWALLITFLISLTESLAIVGSIIPGSVTMTAIGILAGSGVMSIDLTLIAAILGAVVGDGLSYLIGYAYSDKLNTIWPFSRYPEWLLYGKDFFSRHGGKSVLIGRFIGPLRSIIPVIAGMMHMSHLRFFLANFFSAIGWSILYIFPGILIGAASTELSPEAATRLFAFVLISLGFLWLVGLLIKYIVIRIQHYLHANLAKIWIKLKQHPNLTRLIKFLSPAKEADHYQTAALFISLILSLSAFILLTILLIFSVAQTLNTPIHLFIQSLRTGFLDGFLVLINEMTNLITLAILNCTILAVLFYYQDWRKAKFWLYLNLSSALLILLCQTVIHSPYPTGFVASNPGNSYPDTELTFATAQLTSIGLYVHSLYAGRFSRIVNTIIILSLVIFGFASVYLGENWLTDILGAYSAGIGLSIFHWMLYRKNPSRKIYSAKVTLLLTAALLAGLSLSLVLNYQQTLTERQAYIPQYLVSHNAWWKQQQPILPLYRTNRIGKPVNFFNFQYHGSVDRLEKALAEAGWKKQEQTLVYSIMNRMSGNPFAKETPLMAQLYLNKRPVLVMIYQPKSGATQIFKLWRSNFYLAEAENPIWLGSVYPQQKKKAKQTLPPSIPYLSQALAQFSQRQLLLRIEQPKSLVQPVEPRILLVENLVTPAKPGNHQTPFSRLREKGWG